MLRVAVAAMIGALGMGVALWVPPEAYKWPIFAAFLVLTSGYLALEAVHARHERLGQRQRDNALTLQSAHIQAALRRQEDTVREVRKLSGRDVERLAEARRSAGFLAKRLKDMVRQHHNPELPESARDALNHGESLDFMETSEWRRFRYDADMYERSILRKYAEFFEDEVSSLVFELARCGVVDEALMIKAHRPQFSIIVTRVAERLQSLSEASQ